MDNLLNDMVAKGLAGLGRLLMVGTKPYQADPVDLYELWWYNDRSLPYEPSGFVLWLYNGMEIDNKRGGLN